MPVRKIVIIMFLALALTSCNEDTAVSEENLESPISDTTNNTDSPSLTEEVDVDDGSISILSDSAFNEESSDEILSDSETNILPSDSPVVFSDAPFSDQPPVIPPVEEEPEEEVAAEEPAEEESPAEEPAEEEVAEVPSDDQGPAEEPAEEEVAENPSDDNQGPAEAPDEEEVAAETQEDEENEVLCRKEGNLLINGSFELSDDRVGSRGKALSQIKQKSWDVFQSLPSGVEGVQSWYTSDGPGIEVQGDNTVTAAAHKNRVVELDSHGGSDTNSTMSQDVLLCRGKHVIKFMYYPRTKKAGDNTIEVKIDNKVIKTIDMVKTGEWIRVRAPFRVKEKKKYTISFAAKGLDNSLGGLVDSIKLHKRKRRAGVVTSLLSLGDQDNIAEPLIRKEIATAAIRKYVNFASIKKRPKVLFLKDTRHGGESLEDFNYTESILRELYGSENVSVFSEDLRMQNAEGFDVIYVINPGYPLGSSITSETLSSLKEKGTVGIVLHGDDMARGRNFNLSALTGLKYKNNGTSACGIRLNNNVGNQYTVKLRKRFFKKLSVESRTLSYGNDIDHTEIIKKKMRILAMAKTPKGCDVKVPAVVGYKLKMPKATAAE